MAKISYKVVKFIFCNAEQKASSELDTCSGNWIILHKKTSAPKRKWWLLNYTIITQEPCILGISENWMVSCPKAVPHYEKERG